MMVLPIKGRQELSSEELGIIDLIKLTPSARVSEAVNNIIFYDITGSLVNRYSSADASKTVDRIVPSDSTRSLVNRHSSGSRLSKKLQRIISFAHGRVGALSMLLYIEEWARRLLSGTEFFYTPIGVESMRIQFIIGLYATISGLMKLNPNDPPLRKTLIRLASFWNIFLYLLTDSTYMYPDGVALFKIEDPLTASAIFFASATMLAICVPVTSQFWRASEKDRNMLYGTELSQFEFFLLYAVTILPAMIAWGFLPLLDVWGTPDGFYLEFINDCRSTCPAWEPLSVNTALDTMYLNNVALALLTAIRQKKLDSETCMRIYGFFTFIGITGIAHG